MGELLLVIIVGFFIWTFTRKSTPRTEPTRDEEYLIKSISEFESLLKITPDKTVKSLLEQYRKELESKNPQAVRVSEDQNTSHQQGAGGHGFSWSQWYSRNSINLLLYVGAFLIVTSASIFVGFQWESIPGIIKASLLTFVGVSFFGFGVWFFRIPKIKDAGSTFIAIGALLIPVCGSAWYNFVLSEIGVRAGIVWLFTSLIALGVYSLLAFSYKNKFYTYASSVTSLSLLTSVVNTFNLDPNFYILAGIISSFSLMLFSFVLRKQDKNIQSYALIPLQTSAQIMMPVTLAAGLVTAVSQGKLFTFESVLSVLLSAGFYVLSYLYFRKALFMACSEVLFSASIILFFNWQKYDQALMLFILDLCAFAYLYKASILKKYNLKQEVDAALVVGLAQSVILIPYSLTINIDPFYVAILSLAPAVSGVIVAFIKNEIRYLGISSLSLSLALPLLMSDVFKIPNFMDYLGYGYTILGLIFYAACVYLKQQNGANQVFGLSALLFAVLSFIFGFNGELQRLIIGSVLAVIAGHAAWVFNKKEFVYISNGFIMFAFFNLMEYLNINSDLYPFYFSATASLLYAVSFISFPEERNFKEQFRIFGLAAALIIPIPGGLSGLGSFSAGGSVLEKNSLITAYLVTLLYGVDMFIRKTPNFGYVTSAIGMVTFLWQISYLGISDSLAYTVPLGLYFMALALTRKLKDDNDGRLLFDSLGLFFLLAPPAISSLGSDQIKYSALLAIAGVCLLTLGIPMRYKVYSFAGVAAIVLSVLPQTYSYILNLPRWLVVGVGGLIFISAAIFLSLRRKESE